MTTEPTITEFLNARYAEEEAAAREATPGPWKTEDADEYGAEVYTATGTAVAVSREGGGVGLEDAAHIALWDPARVLREIAAKRAILELHAEAGMGDCAHSSDPCPTLRHLAAVYADHPDYQPEWAP